MAQDLKASVIQVHDTHGNIMGTGFVIDANTAVTCAHVLGPTKTPPGQLVTIAFALTGDTCSARVLADARDPAGGNDIAILRLPDKLQAGLTPLSFIIHIWSRFILRVLNKLQPGVTPAILGPSDDIGGRQFQAFGYSKVGKFQGVWAEGKILGPITDQDGAVILHLRSQEIAPGMSGAPVLDITGDRIVGMVHATYLPGDKTPKFRDSAFAIPAETIAKVYPIGLIPPKVRRLSTVRAITILLIIVLSGGFGYWAWITFSSPPPDSAFRVGIAEFTLTDDSPVAEQASKELGDWFYQAVQRAGARLETPFNFAEPVGPDKIGPVPGDDSNTRSANAGQIALDHQVTLLIYGVITRTDEGYSVQPEFYVSPRHPGFEYGSEVIGANRLGQPAPFNLPLGDPANISDSNKKLFARTQALEHIIIGLTDFYIDHYGEAWLKFRRAAELDDWEDKEGKEVVYLLMGAAKLLEAESVKANRQERSTALDQAWDAFMQAYQLNPNYARSYLGLGAVALQQATIVNADGSDIERLDPEKLIDAEKWYSNSLKSSDQPASAQVTVKANLGLGQIYLIGYEFGVLADDWYKNEARRFLTNVVDNTPNSDKDPELTWFIGLSQGLLCRLDGLDEAWAMMASQCRQAIHTLESIPRKSARIQREIANYWLWFACAEKKQGQMDEARRAFDEAISAGEGYISAAQLEKWQAERDTIEEGASCREP